MISACRLLPAARVVLAAVIGLGCLTANAAPCANEDFETRVTGESHCLVMRRYGPTTPHTLVVWLHGDVSSGGPANYHFRLAESTATAFAAQSVMAVALVRPGYPDGHGGTSGVSLLHGGRRDHYTLENLGEVAGAVARLKTQYRPQRVILVGHSGGAATSAVVLGMRPGLADGAVLIACPCEKEAWRARRNGAWPRSENPLLWTDRVAPLTRVRAITGGADDNTLPELAIRYVDALQARGIEARFRVIEGRDHNDVTRAPAVHEALAELLGPR